MQRLRSSDRGRFSSHSELFSYGLCAACSIATSFLSTTSGSIMPWGVVWLLGLHVLLLCPHPSKRVEQQEKFKSSNGEADALTTKPLRRNCILRLSLNLKKI